MQKSEPQLGQEQIWLGLNQDQCLKKTFFTNIFLEKYTNMFYPLFCKMIKKRSYENV